MSAIHSPPGDVRPPQLPPAFFETIVINLALGAVEVSARLQKLYKCLFVHVCYSFVVDGRNVKQISGVV
jgi:hypothetical protein